MRGYRAVIRLKEVLKFKSTESREWLYQNPGNVGGILSHDPVFDMNWGE